MSYRITTYKDAFESVLGIPFDKRLQDFVKQLEKDGHTEKSIAYSIWRTQEKLSMYVGESRFLGILNNEILKYSWRKNDPRWDNYWEKRKERELAQRKQKQLNDYYKKESEFQYDKVIERKIEKGNTPKKPKGYVYFVQGSCGGAIKIGYSVDPDQRLKQLQTGYPDILKILLLIPGNDRVEKYFHNEFSEHRLNGEWFRPDKVLLNRISELKIKYNQV